MSARTRVLIGIDVGGTFTKVGAATLAGRVVQEAQLSAEVKAGPRAFVQRVSKLVDAWRRSHRELEIAGIGMGVAGDVDGGRGRVRFSPNLPGWEDFDFRGAFEKTLRRRVVIENDANAAVWGGYVLDLKRKPRNVAGVTLGTGVGGGIILDGRLLRGSTGSAGEVGHTKIELDGEPCHCGDRGCLEAYAGGYGIVRTARKVLAERPDQGKILTALVRDLDELEPRHLTAAADQGDGAAKEVWERVGRALGVGLSNLVLLLNLDVVLILGGVSRAGRWITDPVERVFEAQPFRTPFARVKVRLADSTKAGWIGAALLSMETAS